MKNNRRSFIKNASLAGLSGVAFPNIIMGNSSKKQNKHPEERNRPKVLFFDVNETLLDLTALKKSVGEALGGRGELLPLWFTTMLQYSIKPSFSSYDLTSSKVRLRFRADEY